MLEIRFTGKQLKEYGWDGNLATLEDFKKKLKDALELGWNPNEISLQTFYARLAALIGRTLRGDETSPEDLKVPLVCELSNNTAETSLDEDDEEELEDEEDDDDEDDIDSRRRRAEEAGWDEEEMDLEEFEDYYL